MIRACALAYLAVCALTAAGCSTLSARDPSLIPTRTRVDAGPFAIYTNGAREASAPIANQLMALRSDVDAVVGLPNITDGRPIEVYILDDRSSFRHFLTSYYPELPQRRAFFFAQGDRRVVYAYQGERLEEDLRHEATHALLNQAITDLPLWLDEGLAEYFESGKVAGTNSEHLRHLPKDLAEGWQPDLARLEQLDDVRVMTPRDYREAWSWVHYFLHSSPKSRAELITYLADLRAGQPSESLSARVAGLAVDAPKQLISHVKAIDTHELASTRQARRAVVRMQNTPERRRPLTPVLTPPAPVIERVTAPVRAFFDRLAGRMGMVRE